MEKEEHCKQITLACARSVSATLGLPPLMAHTAQALGCSAGNHLRLALGCMHLPGLSHSGSGTQVVLRGADSVGPAFCALPGLSSSGDEVFGEHGHCDLSPPPFLPLNFLGVKPVHLFGWMLTIQNPKKSWLAKKPAYSLVDNVSLGMRLSPSGSGCLSPEGDGLQPA